MMKPKSRAGDKGAGRGQSGDLPASAAVGTKPARAKGGSQRRKRAGNSLRALLLKHAGRCEGLPPDLAENHDHYLHGTPKRAEGERKSKTYRGHIHNGAVVLEKPARLPEGTEVEVSVQTVGAKRPTLGEKLLKYAGMFEDLPRDFARHHDHYLHGTPKR